MFAVIHVPDFALQCVLRREPELRDCALAIVDDGLPARIRQMTSSARASGVSASMTTTQALGRCSSLLFRTPGPLAAASACLLQCAESFSPWLEATGEGVVTLEWHGDAVALAQEIPGSAPVSRAVFGVSPKRTSHDAQVAQKVPRGGTPRSARATGALPGEFLTAAHCRERAHAIVAQLARLDFTACVGIATTPDLALLAAHSAEPVRMVERAGDFLKPLPLETLSADAAMCAEEVQAARDEAFRILHRWGIHTLGAFAALPRDQVVARLGEVAAEMWDRATGRSVRPLRLVRAPEIFAEAMELEHEVETLEPLLFILRRFLEQLAARLESSYRVAAVLTLTLRFAAGTPHTREFRIPAPTCDVDVLFRVLSTHLESVTAEAPIVAVELQALPARPERQQFSLFESGLRDPNKFFETLARLHALLGNDRTGTPVPENTHRPDRFHLITPNFDQAPADAVPEPISGPSLQRYRPPIEARVRLVNDRPASIFSDQAFGEITACRGPWPSSGDWWEEGRTWSRIEWDIEVGDQLYRLAQQGEAWFLDGTYD